MATPKLRKGLGRKADAPDEHDYRINGSPHLGVGAPLPTSVDVFSGLDLPVYDQRELGSCTANAGVLYRRFLAQRFAKYSASDQNLSRMFLYYQERKLPWNHTVEEDSGAAIRDIFYVLAHTGVCPEGDDPYVLADFTSTQLNDSTEDFADAQKFRIGAYHRVPDVTIARSVLASGYAVALGLTVYESFEDVGADGIVHLPRPGEAALGGHAVVIRGYDDHRSSFLCQNSWGESWGAKGLFWVPYDYIERTDLSQPDMWMGHLGKPWRKN